jgi:phi13 family phage major tail protein
VDKEYGEFIGVDKVYTFDVLEDNEGNYIAGVPEYFAPVAEISGEAKTDVTTTYYDNKAGNSYVSEGATELKMTVSNVPAKKMAAHLGKDYDVASGRVLDSGEPNPPDKGIMFRYNMGKSGYRYYCYLNGTFSGGAEAAATKGDKVDVKTYETTFTAGATSHEWMINGIKKSIKRIFGDTADLAFDATGWFDRAQTPGMTAAPSAVALTTSVPADAATAVVKTAAIVLTFNNKIAKESITLISSIGDLVAVTKVWDATGKILTIAPSVALTGTLKYIISIAGVVDAYGQALATVVRDFTTVA